MQFSHYDYAPTPLGPFLSVGQSTLHRHRRGIATGHNPDYWCCKLLLDFLTSASRKWYVQGQFVGSSCGP
jgi:hypothetical protein